MIKIKDYIYHEKDIKEIWYDSKNKELRITFYDKVYYKVIKATVEDIEWNYGNSISESLSYDLAKARIKELEEDLDAEKSTNSNLARRILKAIEYIRSEYTITDDDVYLALYSSDGTLGKLENILEGKENE